MSDQSNDTPPLPPPPPDAKPNMPPPPPDARSQASSPPFRPKGSLRWARGLRIPGGLVLLPLIAFGLRWCIGDLPNRSQHQKQTNQVAQDSENSAPASSRKSTPSSSSKRPSYDYLLKRNGQESESDDGPYNRRESEADKADVYNYRVISGGGNRTPKDQDEPFRYNYDYLLDRDNEPGSERKGRPFTYDYDRLMRGANQPDRELQARLKLRWSEATPELLPLLERLTPQQRVAWGVAAVASGFDIYGARVQLINIGHQAVEVSPAKLRVHFGDEAARVFVADDPRFLKPVVLHRGQAASGLVMFTARADIGAAIRLGEGEMAYVDAGVETVYK